MTTKRLFRAYVDETGDRGHGSASSPFFCFTAVVVEERNRDQIRRAKHEINKRIARQADAELHWSANLKDHEKRFVAAEEVAQIDMRVIYVVLDKSAIPSGSHLGADRDAKYNYLLRFLLERISWLVDDSGGEAIVTLAAVRGLPKRIPLTYVEKLRDRNDVQIRWQAIRKIVVHQAKAIDGLQIADVAAGALDRAIRPHQNAPHRIEPAYLRVLAHRIYSRSVGRIASYGMKSISTNFWERFDWWADFKSLPENPW